MSVVLTFDTLKFANRLKAAGVPSQQAEAMAEAQLFGINLKGLMTREMLRQELTLLEQRMTIKLGGLMMASVGIVAALVKLL